MAQQRYLNYKDALDSFDDNTHQIGVIDAGRYRGFEAVLGAGMNLTLSHTLGSGATRIDDTGLIASTVGLWITTQGCTVTEDAPITSLPIAPGHATLPRIDLIVGQHHYQTIIGGAAATYVVITGIPNANPSVPALTLPTRQTILGQIYVPANTTNLTDAGVVYTPANVPNYGGDGTIAHTNVAQTFTALQTFTGTSRTYATITTISANLLVLPTLGLDMYIMALAAPPASSVRTAIAGISSVPTPAAGTIRRIQIYTPYALRLLASWLTVDRYIQPNSWFVVTIDGTGTWRFESGDAANISGVNKFNGTQILKTTALASVFLDAAGRLSLPATGNIMYLQNNASPLNVLNAIIGSNALAPTTTDGGGFLELIPTGAVDLTINPFQFIGGGYKPIWTPNEKQITHRGGCILRLIEDSTYWRVCSWEPAWSSFTPAIVSASGGTATLISISFRYLVTSNKVEIQCKLVVTTAGGCNSFRINALNIFPQDYIAATTSTNVPAILFANQVGIGTAEMLNANIIQLRPFTGNFANAANVPYAFAMTYELQT